MTTFGRGKQLFLTATKITTWWEITQFDVRVARGVAAYLNAKVLTNFNTIIGKLLPLTFEIILSVCSLYIFVSPSAEDKILSRQCKYTEHNM